MYVIVPSTFPHRLNLTLALHVICLKVRHWILKASQGLGNAWQHYLGCVGSPEELKRMVLEARAEKIIEEEELRRTNTNGDPPPPPARAQRTLGNAFVLSDVVRSLFMWIELIVKKNIPITHVDDPLMQSYVKYGAVKSRKTVMDTAHRLVRIVEEKIKAEMEGSPKSQLIFDGYTYCGQHFVGLFASYCEPFIVKTDG